MSKPAATVIEHVQSPRNAGVLPSANAIGYADLDGRAPRITLYLVIQEDNVREARFQTFGCGYSIACCSVLTEMVHNMSLAGCDAVTNKMVSEALGGLPANKRFCADLAVQALRNALTNYHEQHNG